LLGCSQKRSPNVPLLTARGYYQAIPGLSMMPRLGSGSVFGKSALCSPLLVIVPARFHQLLTDFVFIRA
jgi:hypothetical protein